VTRNIALAKIDPNPDQPRKTFDAAHIEGLAASIRAQGLLQAITVRPHRRGRFEIVAGECRWRAHKLLADRGIKGFSTIKATVVRLDDLARDIAAIVENLQRQDISPIEEARGFARLAKRGLEPEQIAKQVGCAVFRVRWRLQLLNLAPPILRLFEADQIDRQQAMEISRLTDHRAQHRILRLISRGQLQGWKAVRNAVDAIIEGATQADIFGDAAPKPSREEARRLTAMEARIEEASKLLGAGWRNGECVVAARVSLDRAGTMADRLNAIAKTCGHMERELRQIAAQGRIVLPYRRTGT
jgi:ParB family chromosome partitioning protein